MNIKYIIVVALAVLALGIASIGAIAPGVSSGQKMVETSATAYVVAGKSGEMSAPRITIHGAKPGIVSGSN